MINSITKYIKLLDKAPEVGDKPPHPTEDTRNNFVLRVLSESKKLRGKKPAVIR